MHRLTATLLLSAVVAVAPRARAHAGTGTVVEDAELPTAAGGRARLLSPPARLTALVYFRAGQERSEEALAALAACEKALAGHPVRFVALVPGDTQPAVARALAARAGIRMPVLLDEGDAIYSRLSIRLAPVVFLVDGDARIVDFEQYREIDYREVVEARIRYHLGEIDAAALARVESPPRNSMPSDDPRDVSTRDVNMGRKLLERRELARAAAAAQKALERAPSPAAFALLGDVAAARGSCA